MPISLQMSAGIKHDNNSIDYPKHGYIYMDIYLDKREESKVREKHGSWQLGWLHSWAMTSTTENWQQKRLLRDCDGARQ